MSVLFLIVVGLTCAGVAVKSRRYHLKSYDQCFVASDLVNWLCERTALPRPAAICVAQRLHSYEYFAHVADRETFDDGHFFYRWARDGFDESHDWPGTHAGNSA